MPKKKATIEEVYEVECITAARVKDNKQWEYNIKWGGYDEQDNSWEPEANLNGCARMMTEFWIHVGVTHKSLCNIYEAGFKVAPDQHWMDIQRDTYQKSQEKKKAQKNKLRHTKPKEISRGKVPPPPQVPFWASEAGEKSARGPLDDDSDDDDIPLSMKTLSIKVKTPAAMNTRQASSSKRKRDDESSPEPSNKRLKSKAADESPIKVSKELPAALGEDDSQEVATLTRADIVQGALTTSGKDDHAQNPIASPSKANEGGSPASSHEDSLFGDGSDSDDIPLASSVPRSTVSQITKEPTPTVTQLPMSPEKQVTEKSKIPLHRQRKQNPLVKPMTLPLLDTNLGGISTKTRILSQSRAGPSPKSSTQDNAGGPASGPMFAETPDVATPDLDANVWLKENINSKDELTRAAQNTSRTSSVEPSSTVSATQVPRFSKRWRWTGQLAVGDNEAGIAEPIGRIVVTDNTPPIRNTAKPTFELLLPLHVDTICLLHHYTLSMLQTVLGDFILSQFAVMTADKTDDENSFDDFVSYMSKHELFSQSPLAIRDLEAATMFVFPSTCLSLLDRLSVPVKVRQERGLVVAIGFKAYIPPKRVTGSYMWPYTEGWKIDPKVDIGQEARPSDCNRARLALNFPESLFLRLSNKQCSIFTTTIDKDLPGHESRSLNIVLENAPGCKIVPLATGNARFIFIHVASWDILHKLPGLVDRRLRRPDVQFYTYGSDPSVDRKRWGVHEVFPIGGIVTFTPRAIVENPTGVEQLITKLDEHPLWSCYILPSVIPKLCEIAAESGSTEYAAKSSIEALCSILLPIEKGQIALTWQPPERLAQDANFGAKWVDWMMDQGRLSDLRGNDLVLECQKRFQRQQDRSEKAVEAQIVRDLLVMQSELREDYRRFVIITDSTGPSNTSKEAAASTSSSKADIKDGFELTHVKDFVFNDDYFAPDST